MRGPGVNITEGSTLRGPGVYITEGDYVAWLSRLLGSLPGPLMRGVLTFTYKSVLSRTRVFRKDKIDDIFNCVTLNVDVYILYYVIHLILGKTEPRARDAVNHELCVNQATKSCPERRLEP